MRFYCNQDIPIRGFIIRYFRNRVSRQHSEQETGHASSRSTKQGTQLKGSGKNRREWKEKRGSKKTVRY
jgi:hypothetical protein